MSFKKKLVTLLFVLLWVAACEQNRNAGIERLVSEPSATPETTASEEQPSGPEVALILKTVGNPFFAQVEQGAREAESKLGLQVQVKAVATETAVEQQIALVEEAIQAEVDAIVIAPMSATELVPPLAKAQQAGILVINIDDRLDPIRSQEEGLLDVPYVGVDNEQGAYLAAKFLADRIGQPTQVAILEGAPEASNAQARTAGALRAFQENRYTHVVATETAHWKIDEAYQVIGSLYEAYPEIGAVFSANDMMALGVLKYLEETGRSDVLVAGYDALDEAREAVRQGKLLVTVDQQAARQGYLGVEYAWRGLQGEELPKETLIDIRLVTQENVDQ